MNARVVMRIVMVLVATAPLITTAKGAIRTVGSFNNQTHNCPVRITLSDLGGFRQLHLPSSDGSSNVVKDVTAILFLDGQEMAYSVSPLYGKPGIFIFDCEAKKTRRIAAPRRLDYAYPDGADYFELYSFEKGKLKFYYAADVDRVDFATLRRRANLYQVSIRGSEFRKSP